jgi:hypothetical protein
VSKKIERWQAEQLNKTIRRQLNYLRRLQGRMVEVGFSRDDKLLQLVRRAYEDVFSRSVDLHYLSCASGVGRPPNRDEPKSN